MKPLEGKRVVIVGGTSGMGRGAAHAAAGAGAEVIVAGRRRSTELASVVLDVTDEASVRATFDGLDALDHLLVTAAPPPGSWDAFLKQDVAAAQAYMNAKFFGSWACARYAAPKMRDGGSITFLTGAASVKPSAGSSIVTATFAALEALSRALAIELGPLRVNTIRPGLVDSEMWSFLDEAGRDGLRRTAREKFPVHRIGTVEDIGHAAVFLMTNSYITGSILEITGGEQLVDAFK